MSVISVSPNDFSNLAVSETTAKLQHIIDGLAPAGGQITLSAGSYHIGSLHLISNFTLKLEAGAILDFSDDPADFPIVESRWEGATQQVYQACLYGNHLHNVQLIGDGVVDGHGAKWWDTFKNHSNDLEFPRPYLCSIENSERLTIDGLTFKNSPAWTLHPMLCHNVLIHNVTVINPNDSPNTDGLDPESCDNVRITDCCFDVGDDCIAIKAGTEDARTSVPCRNLVISNCNMLHGHGGVVLGSEMSGNIQNVAISNCTFQDTDRGIRFKTRRGRGGIISEISATNVIMDNVLCPIVINTYYFCGKKGQEKYVWTKEKLPLDDRTPQVSNLSFSHLTATRIRSCAVFLYGLPEANIHNVQLTDSIFELAPDSQPEAPAMIADAPKFAHAGYFIENSAHVTISNVQLSGAEKAIVHNVSNKDLTVI